VDGHDLEAGQTLAGRYRIEDLVGETAGSRTWRAVDLVLNRSVGVQALSSADPRSVAFLEAARASTAVPDPRFLRVLDAVAAEGGLTYVVREWSQAVPLAVLLREGPLTSRRAATLVSEVADALARAHDVGVYHRRIDPTTILVKDNDAVRITGLGTDHALHTGGQAAGPPPNAASLGGGAPAATAAALHAEQVDVAALGRVLYACLVARWPGGREFGLPPAPTEHGRLLRPRQVRAGVSRDVDRVCDRILGDPPRHHAPPLRSARDIAAALVLVGEDETEPTDVSPSLGGDPTVAVPTAGTPGVPPALLGPPGRAAHGPDPSATRLPGGRRPGRGSRTLVASGVALLVAMAAVLAFYVGRQTAGDPAAGDADGSSDPSSNVAVASRPLEIRAVSDFDPEGGDLSENTEDAPNAVDGEPTTSWTTSQYTSPKLGGLKSGVGLLLDLGGPKTVTALEISFGDAPTRYEVRATPPDATGPPTQLSQLNPLVKGKAGKSAKVSLGSPVTTQFLLVWLTRLPEEAPGLYRGVIKDIAVEGSA